MTRHYFTKDFFRQMPNALLARYFHRNWEQNYFFENKDRGVGSVSRHRKPGLIAQPTNQPDKQVS